MLPKDRHTMRPNNRLVPLFEITRLSVRPDHFASIIVNPVASCERLKNFA
jgi:hypothetical protein